MTNPHLMSFMAKVEFEPKFPHPFSVTLTLTLSVVLQLTP